MSEEKMNQVYGIDLGTTYSAISYVNELGKPEIIPNSDNERVTPSVVFFESLENVIVGKIAKESAKTDPDRVISFVKREMCNTDWTFDLDGKSFRPEEISGFILKRLAGDAQKTAGHEVRDVVITCPAYFGDLERSRTRDAGKLAGLNVVGIVDEPVAAAIYYSLRNQEAKGKNIIVYDLGGGTFDVTVVKIGADPMKNDVEVICTDGDHKLGGKDWDDAIIQYYAEQFRAQTGSEGHPEDEGETAYDLQISAENDKKTLSNRTSVKRKIFFDGETAEVELTREKFNELTQHLLGRTVLLTDKVLDEAKKRGIERIDAFLLVGGSTRMPQVAEKVKEVYTPRFNVEPDAFDVDEAVAKGAALVGQFEAIKRRFDAAGGANGSGPTQEQIARFAEETGKSEEEIRQAVNTNIKRIATKSYGLRSYCSKNGTEKERIFNLILKQSEVPARQGEEFYTRGFSTMLSLDVYTNNESEQIVELEMGSKVGHADFPLPKNLPANSPLDVVFNLSEEGILHLFALDKTFQQQIEADFKVFGAMDERQMEEARQSSSSIVVS